jgi:hypothetical protein
MRAGWLVWSLLLVGISCGKTRDPDVIRINRDAFGDATRYLRRE